jgi:hypothetical protein
VRAFLAASVYIRSLDAGEAILQGCQNVWLPERICG